MGFASGNFIDFERQAERNHSKNENSVNESDEIHRRMIEVEPLLEAS